MEVGQFNRCQCNRPIQRELLEAGNAIRLCACSMAASQKLMAIRDPGPNWGEDLSLGSDHRCTRPHMAAKVEIYTWRACPFCVRAKALLDRKGVAYTEYAIDGDEQARAAMAAKSGGRRSVPQTFINGQHVGGCDDLHALKRRGQLDALLAG